MPNPRILTIILLFILSLLIQVSFAAPTIEMYYFYGADCPHCQELNPQLDEIEAAHPNLIIYRYEVYYNDTNYAIFDEFRDRYGIKVGGVPVFFSMTRTFQEMLLKKRLKARSRALKKGKGLRWWKLRSHSLFSLY
jgi:thiol-disulfide isomerase/thioredoxin